HRKLDGVGVPRPSLGNRPFEQGRAETTAGHLWCAVKLAEKHRSLRLRRGPFLGRMSAHDQRVGGELALRFGYLNQRWAVSEMCEIGAGRAILGQERGKVVRPI